MGAVFLRSSRGKSLSSVFRQGTVSPAWSGQGPQWPKQGSGLVGEWGGLGGAMLVRELLLRAGP